MDELDISWTRTALKQRNHIFHYWNKRNKSKIYSRKLNNAIWERLYLLKQHPNLGKSIEFEDIRMISLWHYSILYKVVPTQIIVTAIWDNRQESSKFLKFLRKE